MYNSHKEKSLAGLKDRASVVRGWEARGGKAGEVSWPR